MEDWTDIIGEELEKFQEPLPADDWKVLQQKYSASRRRKRRAAFGWAGGIASVAAAVILVLVLALGEAPAVQGELVADNLQPIVGSELPEEETVHSMEGILQPVEESSIQVEEPLQQREEALQPVKKDVSSDAGNAKAVDKTVADGSKTDENAVEETTGTGEETIKVVSDTTLLVDKLVAEATAPAKDNNKGENVTQSVGAWDIEELQEEVRRKRRPVSIGMAGSVSGSGVIRFMSYIDGPNGAINDPTPEDSLSNTVTELTRSKPVNNKNYTYTDSYRHELPIAIGISARYYIADRVTFNTGLNYTKYISQTGKRYNTGEYTKVKQYAHYLGVPLRLDWMAVERPHFNFYMGAGMQVDKCVYAVIENERLYEKHVLFAVGGVIGFQVNIMPLVGIYFEPEISYNVNKGTIETLRSDLKLMVSARGGLRFNF